MANQPRIAQFQEESPSLESYWHSAILFGRNTSTYKFALARSIEDIAREGRTSATLEELAVPYSRHMCEHLAVAPKQATGRPGKFIDACASFNAGTVGERELVDAAVSTGFAYVLDAYHNVNGAELPVRFFNVLGRGRGRTVALTDELFRVLESAPSVGLEAEARWGLVEHAWEAGVSQALVSIAYDGETGAFCAAEGGMRRRGSHLPDTPSTDTKMGGASTATRG